LENARVTLHNQMGGQPAGQATTDKDGKFSIANIAPGSYMAVPSRVGFVMGPAGGPTAAVRLKPGDKRGDLKLTLTPGGVIVGRILDANGDPVENAVVFAVAGAFSGNNRAWTDEQGRFRIGGLWPGKYIVGARPVNPPFPPETRTDGTTQEHSSLTYYGGSLTETGAMKVDARAGAEASGIDIKLIRTPLVGIT